MRNFIVVLESSGLRNRMMINPAHIVKMKEISNHGAPSEVKSEITLSTGEKIRVTDSIYKIDDMASME